MAENWKKAAEMRGLSDADKAKALQKLIIQHINNRLKDLPALQEAAFEKTLAKYPGLGAQALKKEVMSFLKKSDKNLYRELKNLPDEKKALRRGLAEFLTTNTEFFEQKGVLDVLSQPSDSPLWKRLKSMDNAFSGYKGATKQVGHHTTLSSLNDMLNQTSRKWREEFNRLAKEHGYKLGDMGLIGIDPGAHKAFYRPPGKKMTFVKGQIAQRLASLIPNADFDGDILKIADGAHPKLDAALEKLVNISAHGNWAGNEAGFKVAEDLSKLSPQKAFDSARNILDAEVYIADQGKRVDKALARWSNKTAGSQNLDETLDELHKQLDHKKLQPHDIKGSLVKEHKETAEAALKKVKIPKPTDVVEDMSKYYISGQEYMEDLAGAPRGTLRREMMTGDEAKYLQDKIVMQAQIKPKIKPKGVVNLSNIADTTAKVAKNSRLARLFIPSSAIGVALAPLTIADAHARSKRAEQTGHWLDKAQARLAQAEATADVTGAVPNPVSEAVGFGAGISNLLIDAGRWGVNKVRGEDPIQQF